MTHADVIEALLPRGIPIYCEKPLCDDAERARRLAAAGRDRLFVMDKWRYHLGVLAAGGHRTRRQVGAGIGLHTTRIGYAHGHPTPIASGPCCRTIWSIAKEILRPVASARCAVADRADGRLMGLMAMSAEEDRTLAYGGDRHSVAGRQRPVTLLCRDGVAILEDAYADHLVIVANPPPDSTHAQPRMTRRPIQVEMPLLAELSAFVGFLKGGPPPKSRRRRPRSGCGDCRDQALAAISPPQLRRARSGLLERKLVEASIAARSAAALARIASRSASAPARIASGSAAALARIESRSASAATRTDRSCSSLPYVSFAQNVAEAAQDFPKDMSLPSGRASKIRPTR